MAGVLLTADENLQLVVDAVDDLTLLLRRLAFDTRMLDFLAAETREVDLERLPLVLLVQLMGLVTTWSGCRCRRCCGSRVACSIIAILARSSSSSRSTVSAIAQASSRSAVRSST